MENPYAELRVRLEELVIQLGVFTEFVLCNPSRIHWIWPFIIFYVLYSVSFIVTNLVYVVSCGVGIILVRYGDTNQTVASSDTAATIISVQFCSLMMYPLFLFICYIYRCTKKINTGFTYKKIAHWSVWWHWAFSCTARRSRTGLGAPGPAR